MKQKAAQTAGTYTISVEANTILVSSDFNDAVNKCVDVSRIPLLCINGVTTYNDMAVASANMTMMYFQADDRFYYITSVAYNDIDFTPESSNVTAAFVDDVFTVTVT